MTWIWAYHESSFFNQHNVSITRLTTFDGQRPDGIEVSEIIHGLEGGATTNVFDEHRWLAVNIYWQVVSSEQEDKLGMLSLQVRLDWISNTTWAFIDGSADHEAMEAASDVCGLLSHRIEAEGGTVDWQITEVRRPTMVSLVSAVNRIQDQRLSSEIVRRHVRECVRQYLQIGRSAVSQHLDYISRFEGTDSLDHESLNNVGYMYLSCQRVKEALRFLHLSVDRSEDVSGRDYLLPRYNLSMALLMDGRRTAAEELLRDNARFLAGLDSGDESLARMLVPYFSHDAVQLKEDQKPDFVRVFKSALKILNITI